VPIPLFDTGSAAVSRAQAQRRRAQQNYAATAVEVRSAARAARDRLNAARDRALYYQKVLLPLRHSIVEQTQAEFNAMFVGTFDVLRAKQEEIDAGAEYVAALRSYWLARVQLEQVLNGRLPGEAFETSPALPRPRAATEAAGH
jgi:cobalt-zinc-cadmium efflux system outer membrane protein